MLTDKHGKPIASEGNALRSIKIMETVKDGKKVWAIEYEPDIGFFEFEEVFQILGNVTAGIAQNARALKHDAIIKQKLQAELNKEK